ncbi:hypothetical protein F5Y14DRAFT_175525 [Nemania sp. NC0429]|nr:hypothetical protein F5Y14DRAFT_175525 [Nemania sp. NC0429]
MRSVAAIGAVRSYVFAPLRRERPPSTVIRGLASSGPFAQGRSPGFSRADRRLHTLAIIHPNTNHVSRMAMDNLRQLEALISRLDQERAALQQPVSVSLRTPNTISTDFNAADKIERDLRADGHRTWGFVVYRCTYSSDPVWESCLQRINASVQKAMDLYNGRDLLQEGCFKLTVITDAAMFDGANTQAVRQHFRGWRARMLHEEQGSQEDIQSRRQEASPQDWGLPVRYGFCIQIDEASMRSITSDEGERWVNLIKGDWEPRDAAIRQHKADPGKAMESLGEHEDNEGKSFDVENDEEFPAIEGCTEEDVGWMKVQLVGFMPDFYANLRDPNLWHVQYIRPPDIATA